MVILYIVSVRRYNVWLFICFSLLFLSIADGMKIFYRVYSLLALSMQYTKNCRSGNIREVSIREVKNLA